MSRLCSFRVHITFVATPSSDAIKRRHQATPVAVLPHFSNQRCHADGRRWD